MSFSGIYLPDTPVRKPDVNGNSLLRKIHRACRLSLPEPDLSLNLDVADYINSKQGNTPRDAAITIVKLINTRGTHTAVFALCLLDVLVKNCGYPIHLQISRKEFLNELVKRFPERPPLRYTKVQRLILTAIEEWYQTICKHSSYKEDMKYIRDMHSLLKYKGYVFPKINQEDLAVLRPHDRLKTPSEIQKEQEVAQAAKLEELIRRGTPEDLREANKLMKVMAGYKEDNAVNAKQTLLDDLTKLKRKADLLDEMLDASTYTELDNETIVELYSSLKSAQPKFQDIIDEQQADDALVKDMLQFNDIVNQLLRKYQVLKNETPSAPLHVASPSPANSGATTLANEINLIDFGDDDGDDSPGLSSGGLDPVDDILTELNSLKFVQTPLDFGKGGSISFGPTTPQPLAPVETSHAHAHDTFDLLGDDSPVVLRNNMVSMSQPQALDLSADTSPIDEEGQDAVHGPADRVIIHQSENLKAEVEQSRLGDSKLKIISYFSNLSNARIDDLTFMVAVPKSCTLNLLPQSASSIAGETTDGITQEFFIEHPTNDQHKPLKIKWKIMYTLDGSPMEVSSISNLPKA